MPVRLIGFADLAKPIGENFKIDFTGTVKDFESLIRVKFKLQDHVFIIAVNGLYSTSDTFINSNDEVALIPPVSGG